MLRVAHRRNSECERPQHRRLGRSGGVDDALLQRIYEGPEAEGPTGRQRVLVETVDEFIGGRDLCDETFTALSEHLTRQQIAEFCALAGHYDGIAAILATLRIPINFAE